MPCNYQESITYDKISAELRKQGHFSGPDPAMLSRAGDAKRSWPPDGGAVSIQTDRRCQCSSRYAEVRGRRRLVALGVDEFADGPPCDVSGLTA